MVMSLTSFVLSMSVCVFLSLFVFCCCCCCCLVVFCLIKRRTHSSIIKINQSSFIIVRLTIHFCLSVVVVVVPVFAEGGCCAVGVVEMDDPSIPIAIGTPINVNNPDLHTALLSSPSPRAGGGAAGGAVAGGVNNPRAGGGGGGAAMFDSTASDSSPAPVISAADGDDDRENDSGAEQDRDHDHDHEQEPSPVQVITVTKATAPHHHHHTNGASDTTTALLGDSSGTATSDSTVPSTTTTTASTTTDGGAPHNNKKSRHSLRTAHSTRKKSLLSTIFNLFNDVLGAGVVAMPYYFQQSGIIAGPILMVCYALVSDYTLLIIRDLFTKHQLTSYSEMCVRAYGRPGFILANIMIFIFNFGGFVGSLIVLGTILPDFFEGLFGHDSSAAPYFARWLMITLPVTLVAPISYYKGIGTFAGISILSCGSLLFLVGLVTTHFFSSGDESSVVPNGDRPENGGLAFAFAHHELLQAVGGISYLYTCQGIGCCLYCLYCLCYDC